MKEKLIIGILTVLSISLSSAQAQKYSKINLKMQDRYIPEGVSAIRLEGYLGNKINMCINQRILKQDYNELVEPFKSRNETRYWQTEFWGKWILSAIGAYKYTKNPELYRTIEQAVTAIIKTQTKDGYIGNYGITSQLQAWDIWGRKYTLLGLLSYYEISGDKKALDAARKSAEYLLTQVGPGKKDIVRTGKYRGMPSSSILKPIVMLYKYTGEKRYLNFASYIVEQWKIGEGPDLVNKALKGIDVAIRFAHPQSWWSWENGQKAYEMMSCYDGLLDLYKVTGTPVYLKAVEMAVANIIDKEINAAGSGSAFECFYYGKQRQTEPTYHTMETCVTFTWMQLCNNLLSVTGNTKYADQIEETMYNALLASMKSDGSQIAKYSPLEGVRQEGEHQCGMNINCCNANGPRAFVMIPDILVARASGEIAINLYCQSSATVQLNKYNEVQIKQQTNYPENGTVDIKISPQKSEIFTIALRIPGWSKATFVSVNGEKQNGVAEGSYYKITRHWKKDDVIQLVIDMNGRLLKLNNNQAVMWGPVLLARDSRFEDGFVDESAVISHKNNKVALTPSKNKPLDIWMAFTAYLTVGSDLEGDYQRAKPIHFCDFSSAGNTWDRSIRYKTWIKETINVMKTEYAPY